MLQLIILKCSFLYKDLWTTIIYLKLIVGMTEYCGRNTRIKFLKKWSTKVWDSSIEEILNEVKSSGISILTKMLITL